MVMRTFTDFDTIDISLDDLDRVHGGIDAGQWSAITSQAAQYCPATVQKYGGMNPARISKPVAQRMANSCVAEMPGWEQPIARSRINGLLNNAFPKKK
ncbi:MAG TPA: hypothetical protein VGG74_35965 [Kofleriaceae bacterium]|jgi:hypothetical protein